MKTPPGSIDFSPPHRRDRRARTGRVGPVTAGVMACAAAAAIACGATAKQDTAPPGDTDRTVQTHDMRAARAGKPGDMGHDAEAGEKAEMAALPPEVKTFHDALAPRWHAEHGPQRMADTCAAIPELHTDAEAIATSKPPPAANPGDWSANATKLTDAVTALDATCKASDAAAFEQAFAVVHNNFHGLMGIAGGMKAEGGEHAEHHH
jgi:hypothetical protein